MIAQMDGAEATTFTAPHPNSGGLKLVAVLQFTSCLPPCWELLFFLHYFVALLYPHALVTIRGRRQTARFLQFANTSPSVTAVGNSCHLKGQYTKGLCYFCSLHPVISHVTLGGNNRMGDKKSENPCHYEPPFMSHFSRDMYLGVTGISSESYNATAHYSNRSLIHLIAVNPFYARIQGIDFTQQCTHHRGGARGCSTGCQDPVQNSAPQGTALLTRGVELAQVSWKGCGGGTINQGSAP